MGYCASMNSSTFRVKTENTARILSKMTRFGYEPEMDDDGNIVGVEFVGEKISYSEDTMFDAIAPYVEDGSFIEMTGEDGCMWRWVFKNGTCKEQRATITWDDT